MIVYALMGYVSMFEHSICTSPEGMRTPQERLQRKNSGRMDNKTRPGRFLDEAVCFGLDVSERYA